MADFVKNLFGGAQSAVSSAVPSDTDDFADFASPASPSAPSHAVSSAFSAASESAPSGPPNAFLTGGGLFGGTAGTQGRPYTKWYRIWERVELADFYQELVLIPILLLVVVLNLWGSWANKKRAKAWASTHIPILESEFASVGFGGGRKGAGIEDVQSQGLAKAMAASMEVPEELLRQKQKNEYLTYATGRQNIACVEVKISLFKRYNPFIWFGETLLSFFIDSMAAPAEMMQATAHCFDGKEKQMVAQGSEGKGNKDSSYDGFVWAVVHKDKMKDLRDVRYDLSLTTTRDHAKLPEWTTVMSESAEITEVMLTPELVKAIHDAGEDLEALIVTDQPIDAPKKLNDTLPQKRVTLTCKLNPGPTPSTLTLFTHFLRLPDFLVSHAHFRSEAMRKVRTTRDDEQRKIRKVDEDEKAEERRTQGDKMKKEERERKLSKMGAEEQKKFLEKEKEVERRKGMKKKSMRA